MKHFLATLFVSLCFLPTLLAQSDSLRYAEEEGVLRPQRFIDRHEQIFMTKEPTKWMVWAGPKALPQGLGFSAGMEYKFSPSWSGAVLLNVVGGRWPSNHISAELRHYYDMKRRIREGKSANNFTGNYVSFGVGYMNDQFRDTKYIEIINDFYTTFSSGDIYTTFSVNWGAQRRFLKHGLANYGLTLDFLRSDLLGARVVSGYSIPTSMRHLDLGLSTFWTTAIAVGDLKPKRESIPCELVSCSDTRRYILKVAWPKLHLSINRQSLSTSFGYEKQLGNSKFSLNTQWDVQLQNFRGISHMRDTTTNVVSSTRISYFKTYSHTMRLQPRYYFGQSLGSVRALSGLYAGASLLHVFETRKRLGQIYSAIEAGPTLGYQQKVFGKGYLDFGITVGTPVLMLSQRGPYWTNGFVYSNRTNFNVGFAF